MVLSKICWNNGTLTFSFFKMKGAIGRQALEDPNWPVRAKAALLADRPAQDRYAGGENPYGWWLSRRAKLIDKLGPWRG